MDAQLEDIRRRQSALEQGFDRLDGALRGSADHPGMFAAVAALQAQAEDRRADTLRVERKLDDVLQAQAREAAMVAGERRLVAKTAAWAKFAGAVLLALLAGGGVSVVTLLQRLAAIADAVP